MVKKSAWIIGIQADKIPDMLAKIKAYFNLCQENKKDKQLSVCERLDFLNKSGHQLCRPLDADDDPKGTDYLYLSFRKERGPTSAIALLQRLEIDLGFQVSFYLTEVFKKRSTVAKLKGKAACVKDIQPLKPKEPSEPNGRSFLSDLSDSGDETASEDDEQELVEKVQIWKNGSKKADNAKRNYYSMNGWRKDRYESPEPQKLIHGDTIALMLGFFKEMDERHSERDRLAEEKRFAAEEKRVNDQRDLNEKTIEAQKSLFSEIIQTLRREQEEQDKRRHEAEQRAHESQMMMNFQVMNLQQLFTNKMDEKLGEIQQNVFQQVTEQTKNVVQEVKQMLSSQPQISLKQEDVEEDIEIEEQNPVQLKSFPYKMVHSVKDLIYRPNLNFRGPPVPNRRLSRFPSHPEPLKTRNALKTSDKDDFSYSFRSKNNGPETELKIKQTKQLPLNSAIFRVEVECTTPDWPYEDLEDMIHLIIRELRRPRKRGSGLHPIVSDILKIKKVRVLLPHVFDARKKIPFVIYCSGLVRKRSGFPPLEVEGEHTLRLHVGRLPHSWIEDKKLIYNKETSKCITFKLDKPMTEVNQLETFAQVEEN